jgi:hypothetical protein
VWKAARRKDGFEISGPDLFGGIAEPPDEFGVEAPEELPHLGGSGVEERRRALLQHLGTIVRMVSQDCGRVSHLDTASLPRHRSFVLDLLDRITPLA